MRHLWHIHTYMTAKVMGQLLKRRALSVVKVNVVKSRE